MAPLYCAVIVTSVSRDVGMVVTLIDCSFAPAATRMELGIGTSGLLALTVTVAPVDGAGSVSSTLIVIDCRRLRFLRRPIVRARTQR